jgi:hypothetical protein
MGALHQTLLQSGFLGRGIGSATQGGQHLGPGLEQSWQESGPSKLMVELGVPGFVCALLLAVALGRAGWAALRRIPATPLGGLQVGLSGMMIANAASFIVSHQIFGDLLIVCLTSLWLGITLSSPRWARAREPASGATPPLPPQRLRIPAERPA